MNLFLSSPATENEALNTMWSYAYFTPAYVVFNEICETKENEEGILNKMIDKLATARPALK